MNRATHPIATVALRALSRDEAGRLRLDPQGQDGLRAAVEAEAEAGRLHPAIVALVEVAYVVARDGGPEAARQLRAFAAGFTEDLAVEGERCREGQRQRQARFAQFSGQRGPTRALPRPVPAGGLTVADLRPRGPIGAR